MSENPAGGGTEPHRADRAGRIDVRDVRFRIVRPALPVRAGERSRAAAPSGPSILLTTGGVNIGPIAYFFDQLDGFGAQLGREVDQIVDRHARAARTAAACVGNGCVGEYHSPGTSPFATGRSSIGQIGWPVTRSNTYSTPCLVGCATALIVRPLTVMSARIGAHGMSMSQMPWCTSW